MSSSRSRLQEVGAPPKLPTKDRVKRMLEKIEPERLEQVKGQLKEAAQLKRKQEIETPAIFLPVQVKIEPQESTCYTSRFTCSEPSKSNRTHILEMELLKLKGEFLKNKTTTKHLIKKLSNDRELVRDSIKELSSTRREEQDLVEAIKRDNLDLLNRKEKLEVDLFDLSERLEDLLENLGENQESMKDKEERIQQMEMEKSEMRRQIETLEMRLKIKDEFLPVQKKENLEWNPFGDFEVPFSLKRILGLIFLLLLFYFLYNKFSPPHHVQAPFCTDCDYERDVYARIKI